MAKVLMVDDETDMEILVRQKFRQPLKEGAFELLFASSGTEALKIAKADHIDVVVTDVNMPEMDGLTLLDELQSLSPKTKSIVVSAYGDMDTLRLAMNRGAYDFVTKPVDFDDLLKAITRTLDHTQAHPAYCTAELLAAYQTFLCEESHGFKGAEFEHESPAREKAWLFDAWPLDETSIAVLGIHGTSPQLPEPLAVILAHQTFKAGATTDPHKSLNDYLTVQPKHLATTVCYGVYNQDSTTWGYAHSGSFVVEHQSGGSSKEVKPVQTSLLNPGDAIAVDAGHGHTFTFKRT